MKKLVLLNLIAAIIIIAFAVLDLFFYIIIGAYPFDAFPTVMMIVGVVTAIIGGFIGWRLQAAGVKFEDNFISNHLGGVSRYFNDYSTAIAGIALLASSFLIGWVNVITIAAALYTILTSFSFMKQN